MRTSPRASSCLAYSFTDSQMPIATLLALHTIVELQRYRISTTKLGSKGTSKSCQCSMLAYIVSKEGRCTRLQEEGRVENQVEAQRTPKSNTAQSNSHCPSSMSPASVPGPSPQPAVQDLQLYQWKCSDPPKRTCCCRRLPCPGLNFHQIDCCNTQSQRCTERSIRSPKSAHNQMHTQRLGRNHHKAHLKCRVDHHSQHKSQ